MKMYELSQQKSNMFTTVDKRVHRWICSMIWKEHILNSNLFPKSGCRLTRFKAVLETLIALWESELYQGTHLLCIFARVLRMDLLATWMKSSVLSLVFVCDFTFVVFLALFIWWSCLSPSYHDMAISMKFHHDYSIEVPQ